MAVSVASTERVPLSVLLFHAAMSESKSISEFAEQLEIGAISLRQFIDGNTQRPRQKTLELIGGALDMPVEEVRRHMGYSPEAAARFGDWLEEHMKRSGYSRAKLTRDTKISDGALRNYLSNKTRPDSDQAQRIAEVLQTDTMEIARVIIASTVAENGGSLKQPQDEQASVEVGELRVEAPEPKAPPALAATLAPVAASAPSLAASSSTPDEGVLVGLWRQLHPQGRRATLSYIAMLIAER